MIGYRFLLITLTGLALVESSLADANCTDLRISNGPLIYPCVSEVVLQKGQNYTLTCKGVTELQFKQQHISEEVTSNFFIHNTSSEVIEEEFNYESKLELYNVDQFAIGYYACSDNTENISNFIDEITEEPKNTEHVSFIYVYVNGTGSLFAPMRELVISRSNKVLIECRPTTPDVEVQLYRASPDIPDTVYSPKVGFSFNYNFVSAIAMFNCDFRKADKSAIKGIFLQHVEQPPEPSITAESEYFIEGETFSLNCTVTIKPNAITKVFWILPKDNINKSEDTNEDRIKDGMLYRSLKISNATKDHAGPYICVSANTCDERRTVFTKEFTEPFLRLTNKNKDRPVFTRQRTSSTNFDVEAYPKPTFKVLKDGVDLSTSGIKYSIVYKSEYNSVNFMIYKTILSDSGNYTIIAENGHCKKEKQFRVDIGAEPVINSDAGDKKCVIGMTNTIRCDVSGNQLPEMSWIFTYNNASYKLNSTRTEITSNYQMTAYLDITRCEHTGTITCEASNPIGNKTSEPRNLLVYDMEKGFGIFRNSENDKAILVNENDIVTVKCLASKYEYSNVTWITSDYEQDTVAYPDSSEFSYVTELKINGITLNHSGSYRCSAITLNGTEVSDDIKINVLKLQAPFIEDSDDVTQDVSKYQDAILNCVAFGAPRPEIEWYKDGQRFYKNESNVIIYFSILNETAVNSTIVIDNSQPENEGTYNCEAKNKFNSQQKSFFVKLKVEESVIAPPLIAGAVLLFIGTIVMFVALIRSRRKHRQFRRKLAAAGLLYFKEGVTKSLNPDLGISEQAELLPYDEKFEYPYEKLQLGKQLGAGAFGVVYKAEARGIVNAEETTTVAVKMVQKTADDMYIKALISELKIMVHLGKHVNIVNLLGACTKNVDKRELSVIVEFCRYGNIHNYMQRHREVFIDQLSTDNKEKLGKVNRAYTASSCGSTGAHSDYFGSGDTQNTDNTCLNTVNTVRSARKNVLHNDQPSKEADEVKASEGYVQPEWRSNYESDYSYNGRSPRPLTSRDLIAWSFQIARGMDYLASRKVLHGDLAARNILLADDNVVKICDFGLAKSIYKNDEYQKKEGALLPWKWLAIECMTDRIFSTQSDVWSFGIVLWELFTLAKTPYPNMDPTMLLKFLIDGHRLNKPAYADEQLYDVMKKCWEAKPPLRPSFSQLQQLLGSFLEDNVRNHYVEINNACADSNANVVGHEDYLAMVSAPDYNSMVTPSPHHYVNTDRSFFPTTPKIDEEGYLQVSPTIQGIFSPRIQNTEFDFDARKLNAKMSEASSCGSELTPMLTLNNLPRSGSDSDHESNPPYMNACPRIDEEADEVFTPCLDKNTKNISSAVTNPTYITYDSYNEKPKDIISYVNINMPNGLVK